MNMRVERYNLRCIAHFILKEPMGYIGSTPPNERPQYVLASRTREIEGKAKDTKALAIPHYNVVPYTWSYRPPYWKMWFPILAHRDLHLYDELHNSH